MVFWFGDLNFRIEDYDIHVVKCAVDSHKLPLLWERDQVKQLLLLYSVLIGLLLKNKWFQKIKTFSKCTHVPM